MAGRWDCFQGLPHGWEAKFDFQTGRYYFLDDINKQTTWEDPRLKTCPPPPPHPDTIPPEMRSAQTAIVTPLMGGGAYHLFGARWGGIGPSVGGLAAGHLPPYALYGPVYPTQDVISFRGGALPVVPSVPAGILPASKDVDNDMDVAKISAMFPTVPEARIRELLKKYHQRTAVVVSALQVAKYPLATPGPYGTFTPPPARHFLPTAAAIAAFQQPAVSNAAHAVNSLLSRASVLSSSSTSSAPVLRSTAPAVPATTYSGPPAPCYSPSAATFRSRGGSVTSQHQTYGHSTGAAVSSGAAPSLSNASRPSTPEHATHSRATSYERVRGTHLLERIGSIGDQSFLMGGSLGSPRMSTRGSSPHVTTMSTSEVTRSILSSPRPSHSPRPSPHSPKIKLRYLKGLFPSVEPTVILDVLTQCSYNVKDACETLVSKGHPKKDSSLAPPQLKDANSQAAAEGSPRESPKPSPAPSRPKFLSETQNRNIRQRLAESFPDVTPTVLRMALQSVGHDEELAKEVLRITLKEPLTRRPCKSIISAKEHQARLLRQDRSGGGLTEYTEDKTGGPLRPSGRASVRPVLPRPRVNFAWTHTVAHASPTWVTEAMLPDEEASLGRARGPDPKLHRGPSDELLLTDYTPWHGPNCDNANGPNKSLSRGPNLNLRKDSFSLYKAKGPNTSMVKGARPQLAKGSILSQALKKDSPESSKRL